MTSVLLLHYLLILPFSSISIFTQETFKTRTQLEIELISLHSQWASIQIKAKMETNSKSSFIQCFAIKMLSI